MAFNVHTFGCTQPYKAVTSIQTSKQTNFTVDLTWGLKTIYKLFLRLYVVYRQTGMVIRLSNGQYTGSTVKPRYFFHTEYNLEISQYRFMP